MTNEEQDYRMDALFRKRLEGVEAPVSAGLWDRIQLARQERRARPYGWAGFGALVLLTAAYAGWMSTRPPATPAPPVVISGQETAATGSGNAGGSLVLSPEEKDLTDMSGSAGLSGSAAPTSERPSASGAGIRSDEGSFRTRSGAGRTSSRSRTDGTSSDASMNTGTSGQATAAEPGPQQAGTSTNTAQAEEAVPAEDMAGMHRLDNPFALHLLPNNLGPEVGGLPASGLSILQSGKKTPSCYAFNSFLRGLSTDLYIAPEYASRQLVYKDPDMIEYAERRRSTEAYSFAFSAGFRLNAHFKGGLALRSGLIYTDIVEKLTYADPDAEVRRVITVSIDTIYNPPDVIIMVDTLSIAEFGQYDKVGYNNYRFYDVPLILGYELDRGRWIVSLNTGMMLNIGTSRRGNMLDPSANLVSIHSSRPDGYPAFRTKVGTSLLMSLGVNYAIRPKLHLLLEPQLRVWMRPLTLKEYPVDQKYVNLGLAMGIRQYF